MPDSMPATGSKDSWLSEIVRTWISRILLAAIAAGVAFLQTGQWHLQSVEEDRDTDTVALIKLAAEQEATHHEMQLRLQALEIKLSMMSGPVFPMTPEIVPSGSPADAKEIFSRARSRVTKRDIETYQKAK